MIQHHWSHLLWFASGSPYSPAPRSLHSLVLPQDSPNVSICERFSLNPQALEPGVLVISKHLLDNVEIISAVSLKVLEKKTWRVTTLNEAHVREAASGLQKPSTAPLPVQHLPGVPTSDGRRSPGEMGRNPFNRREADQKSFHSDFTCQDPAFSRGEGGVQRTSGSTEVPP